ncbi:type I methionyl aminopeptidase [Acinetobacter ihumii]|uniref:type I methionyl aminopeptidase n=1 Tax=Acinetobacter ihumii TaxID=2483802 RepID=UPI001031083B|nr:type I methionyl aminopeptidase [Acinetobacter ihumii]
MRASTVTIKTEQDIENLRISGRLAAQVLEMITAHIRPGVSTEYLDDICNDYIVNTLQVIPANIGYHGFTKTTCTSVNEVVCHGIPSPTKILADGDIINIDVAIIKEGYFGDTSRMYLVGDVHPDAKKLVETTYNAMHAGIQAVKPGATLGDIGYAIQSVAQAEGYSIVREYCGHGIGKIYHEQPNILHYGQPGQGMLLQKGMVFTIEPMVNAGHAQVKELSDGWTVITKDKSLSAQWEHMVAVTETGYELLTPWPNGTGAYAEIALLG